MMDTINIDKPRSLVGLRVKTFPEKIGEAFNALIKQIPNGDERSCYGISWIEGESIIYYAAAEEREESEASRIGARQFTIEKGTYLREVLKDWMPKVHAIKSAFETMMRDPRVDASQPAIEWYISDEEMWCLLKLKNG